MPRRAHRIGMATIGSLLVASGAPGLAGAAPNVEPPERAARNGGYLVVATALDHAGGEKEQFRQVAQRAAAFHHGDIIDFDGRDFPGLEKSLRERRPRNVLFVVPPNALDCNLHRHIFLMCPRMDDDIFADFAFGYLTASNGAQLQRLWERTEGLHKDGLTSKTWIEASVSSGMKSTVYPDFILGVALAAGFQGPHIFWTDLKSDPDVMTFVDKMLPELERAGVIDLSGNGDPQGIWLFDDARNGQDEKHWDYAPQKVGHDPAGEMPRITADRFARLNLKSPIVWSGTCHSASTHSVYVESDIVSTFGRCEKTVLHTLAPGESLGLALIDAGAGALLAPIGPNHGYSTITEAQFALVHGASLGEAMRSTYNDVLLASRGRPGLVLYEPGKEHREQSALIMWACGANRILIGDPALAPFKATADPLERTEIVAAQPGGLDVRIEWKEGFHPYLWDIYGTDHKHEGRVYTRIALDKAGQAAQSRRFSAEVSGTDAAGGPLPFSGSRADLEEFHGERYLHLQANAPRESIDRKELRATFKVRPVD